MRVWRISNFADLSGYGGEIAAARWNHLGTPIVYCADHPAAALLEIIVHVDTEDLPSAYQLIQIDIPEGTDAYRPDLPSDWTQQLLLTRSFGSNFIKEAKFPVMAVPSVVIPFATNYLLAPTMLKGANIKITSVTSHPFDPRLLR